ncbi:hypothetical protein V3C33_19145 [Micrococcaceae bacterium Sec5.7]
MRDGALAEALLGRCRQAKIEPPGRVKRIIGAARALFEKQFCGSIFERLGSAGISSLEALLADGTAGSRFFAPESQRVETTT